MGRRRTTGALDLSGAEWGRRAIGVVAIDETIAVVVFAIVADFFVIQRFVSACGRLRFIFAFAIFAELICATFFCFCASLCIGSSDAFAFATNGLVGGAVNRFVALLRRVSARRLCFAFELVIGAFLARLTFTTICAFCFIFARIGVGWCFGDAFASRANGFCFVFAIGVDFALRLRFVAAVVVIRASLESESETQNE